MTMDVANIVAVRIFPLPKVAFVDAVVGSMRQGFERFRWLE